VRWRSPTLDPRMRPQSVGQGTLVVAGP
jgi:hypothetical protein